MVLLKYCGFISIDAISANVDEAEQLHLQNVCWLKNLSIKEEMTKHKATDCRNI